MIISSAQIKDSEAVIGDKAKRLQRLSEINLVVPAFVVVPAETVRFILEGNPTDNFRFELENSIKNALPETKLFAVRSCGVIEDGNNSSWAGQFKTVLSVDPNDLFRAVLAVATDAYQLISRELDFSIIIQEYVVPDKAGVLFSRNPLGGREMVVEYKSGNGEGVVGGESVQRIEFLVERVSQHVNIFPELADLATGAHQIENLFDCPQDIEWAIRDGKIYWLQTRPITSLSQASWQGIVFLENSLPQESDYFYEKTSVSETFNQPSPLAFSMLQALYKTGGPIDQSYQKCGVSYHSTNHFVLLGNDLYVDRQAETKSLFPALGFFKYKKDTPQRESFAGWLTTIKNDLALASLSLGGKTEIRTKIIQLITSPLPKKTNLADRWRFFLDNYALIFDCNLRVQKALVLVNRILNNDAVMISRVLSGSSSSDLDHEELCDRAGLVMGSPVGNSLSIDDRSPFNGPSSISGHSRKAGSGERPVLEGVGDAHQSSAQLTLVADSWLEELPRWKRTAVQSAGLTARDYIEVRELARLASVRLISYVREAVDQVGSQYFEEESNLIYFATVDELLTSSVNYQTCLVRKKLFEENQALLLPSRVASFTADKKCAVDSSSGLSPGQAVGILVTREQMSDTPGLKILYTQTLSPDLTHYFADIVGIVTVEGGLLSHLAIMAREAGLPVVVTGKKLAVGIETSIDGLEGEVWQRTGCLMPRVVDK